MVISKYASHQFSRLGPVRSNANPVISVQKTIAVNDEYVTEKESEVASKASDSLAEQALNKGSEQGEAKRHPVGIKNLEGELTEADLKQIRELRSRDNEVRAHEQAHVAAAGSLARGGPSYEYQRGPDGKRYVVGGEVQIDTSRVADDPRATAVKAQGIRRAALAPATPSSADRAIAAHAAAMETTARAEIAQQIVEKRVEGTASSAKDGDVYNEKGSATEKLENGSPEKLAETNSKCAACGGHHSVESHVTAVESMIDKAVAMTGINFEANQRSGSLLNLSV